MGEAPLSSQCCHADPIARLGTLQIAVRTFHPHATQIGQRSRIQVPAERSLHPTWAEPRCRSDFVKCDRVASVLIDERQRATERLRGVAAVHSRPRVER